MCQETLKWSSEEGWGEDRKHSQQETGVRGGAGGGRRCWAHVHHLEQLRGPWGLLTPAPAPPEGVSPGGTFWRAAVTPPQPGRFFRPKVRLCWALWLSGPLGPLPAATALAWSLGPSRVLSRVTRSDWTARCSVLGWFRLGGISLCSDLGPFGHHLLGTVVHRGLRGPC